MNFDPDLINKFQQNLRMAQIHSAGGITESNINTVRDYMYQSIRALEDAGIASFTEELKFNDGVALASIAHLEGPKAAHKINKDALVDDLEFDDETGKISKKT